MRLSTTALDAFAEAALGRVRRIVRVLLGALAEASAMTWSIGAGLDAVAEAPDATLLRRPGTAPDALVESVIELLGSCGMFGLMFHVR